MKTFCSIERLKHLEDSSLLQVVAQSFFVDLIFFISPKNNHLELKLIKEISTIEEILSIVIYNSREEFTEFVGTKVFRKILQFSSNYFMIYIKLNRERICKRNHANFLYMIIESRRKWENFFWKCSLILELLEMKECGEKFF